MAKPPYHSRPQNSSAAAKPSMARPPEPILLADPPISPGTVDTAVLVEPVTATTDASLLTRWLKMETGISGPAISLSRGDIGSFDDTPGADGSPSEAQRLIDAGFAVETDHPGDV